MDKRKEPRCLLKKVYENSEKLSVVGWGHFDDSYGCSKCDGYKSRCDKRYPRLEKSDVEN